MRRVIAFILGIMVAVSCSTSSDNSVDSTTTIFPLPPTNLIATLASSSQINLSWTDNATNETGFKIERKIGSANYGLLATLNQDILTFSDTGLTPNTTYTYRVYAYNTIGNSPIYSNEVSIITTATTALPTLTTTTVTTTSSDTVVSGGSISSDGGSAILERGVCWDTNTNPTIALITKTLDGVETGTFTSNITGLSASTTYYIRAYASNSVGTAYGNEISFTTLQNPSGINVPGPILTDIDGNIYQSVSNCGLTFTQQNLNVTKYSDGTIIPQVSDSTQWANLTTGAWCYQNNDTANGETYGKLYNWYAVAGIYDLVSLNNPALRKKLAPVGWHVPTDAEWTQLTNCLGGLSEAGGKMKSAGISLWLSPNTAATNYSGFTGLPGGGRNGSFNTIGSVGNWWSSSELNSTFAVYRILSNLNGGVGRFNDNMRAGFSVRLLKD